MFAQVSFDTPLNTTAPTTTQNQEQNLEQNQTLEQEQKEEQKEAQPTQSSASPPTKYRKLSPEFVDSPLRDAAQDIALIPFYLNCLNYKHPVRYEDPLQHEIAQVAKKIIELWMIESSDAKMAFILSALDQLQTLASIRMQTTILSLIEQVMRSNYISNVKTLGLFLKKNSVHDNLNHCWSLKGAQCVVSAYHPKNELSIHYVRSPGTASEMEKIKASLYNEDIVWIVAGYERSAHLTLISLKLMNENLYVQVFDSIGTVPSSKPNDPHIHISLGELFTNIVEAASVAHCIIVASHYKRQVDEKNCISFVLSDLDRALTLINNKKILFSPGRDMSKFLELLDALTELRHYRKNDPESIDVALTLGARELHRLAEHPGISALSPKIEVREHKLIPEFYEKLQQHNAPENSLTKPLSARAEKRGNPEALLTSARALRALIDNKTIMFTAAPHQKPSIPEPELAEPGIDNEEAEPKGLCASYGCL